MNAQQILSFVQIGVAVLLVVAVLLQQKGEGLSATFGGGGGGVYRTKRGLERVLLVSTIVLAVAFLGTGLASVFLGVRATSAVVPSALPAPITSPEENASASSDNPIQIPTTNITDLQFEPVPPTAEPSAPDGTR